MKFWRWSLGAGVGVIVIISTFSIIPGMKACGGADPIFAFEMVRSPADVAVLFPGHCRDMHVRAQRIGLWVDIGLFIYTYSMFLIAGLLALGSESRQSGQRMVLCGVVCVVAAAAADQLENFRLLQLLNALPGDQGMIDALYPAPRIKFLLLGVATAIAGVLHVTMPGWRKVAGTLAIFGALVSIAGVLEESHWVLTGSAVGWAALFISAAILSFRRISPKHSS